MDVDEMQLIALLRDTQDATPRSATASGVAFTCRLVRDWLDELDRSDYATPDRIEGWDRVRTLVTELERKAERLGRAGEA